MMNMEVMSVQSETDDPNGEGEGVWSPEIEQAFQEALKLYPPCGRRKHILQEEGGGKMYGRNELIARYIYEKTNCRRTRKQVSSHIQVLARREARSNASRGGSRGGDTDSVSPASSIAASSIGGTDRILSRPDSATSGYINGMMPMEHTNGHHNHHLAHHLNHHHHHHLNQITASNALNPYDFWEDRPIMTRKIRLVEFSAFVEQCRVLSTVAASGNDVGGNSRTALTQAAVLASLAAVSGGANDFSQTGANPPPVPINSNQLQMPPFNAAYASSLAPYQMNNPSAMSNHNLSAQFASAAAYSQNNHNQRLTNDNNNGNHLLHHSNQYNQMNSVHNGAGNMNAIHDRSSSLATPAGFHRHSYVKIDYRQPSERLANKMERIDIREIQDKFPDIGGPDGLFQRGSPDSFFLVKFWADLDFDSEQTSYEDQNSFFGFSSQFETVIPYKDITCSTKACSYGRQVVEKVEKVYGAFNSSDSTYLYAINRSPMCEFMTQFIKKLRQLPELPLMNRILENFTVLQLVTSESNSDILLCIAYVFEIAPNIGLPHGLRQANRGSHYHVYKLTKN